MIELIDSMSEPLIAGWTVVTVTSPGSITVSTALTTFTMLPTKENALGPLPSLPSVII